MVQPKVAYELLADPLASDTGFLPRCLICEPASTIGTRLHLAGRHNLGPVDAFGERLGGILRTPMVMDPTTRELKPRLLLLSSDAKAQLVTFSDKVERAQAPGGDFEMIRGTASKAAEQAARIAGVLTLWADLGAVAVGSDAMANGIDLAMFYLLEAQRLAGAAMVSSEVSKAEALRNWMLSSSWVKPWLTVRDVDVVDAQESIVSRRKRSFASQTWEVGRCLVLEPCTYENGRLPMRCHLATHTYSAGR